MLFDRVLEDSLGYIRRKLWYDRGYSPESAPKTFQPDQSISGESGVLHRLEGRDTPRAVRTWVYSPNRQNLNTAEPANSLMDLHIYTDFLRPLPYNITPMGIEQRAFRDNQRQHNIPVMTHRLQILQASHRVTAEGFYSWDMVFWQDIDLFPPLKSKLSSKTADRLAMLLTDKVAFRCLEMDNPLETEPEVWGKIVGEVMPPVLAKLIGF
ncbi:MAG: hypothetical protein AAFR26_22140 [Cyanobacteria bacterium J06626_4]